MSARDAIERAVGGVLFRLPPGAQLRLAGAVPVVVDGKTLHPEIQLALALKKRAKAKGLSAGTVEAARRRYRRDSTLIRYTLEAGNVRDLDIDLPGSSPSAPGKLRARFYAGNGLPHQAPLLVFFHGGGFCIGDLDTHDDVCRFLSVHARVRVLSVEYRLAPEHPFPAASDDALAAFRWAKKNAEALGVDADRIAVAGDSAGGQIAATLVQDLARADEEQPRAQLLLYPCICRRVLRSSIDMFASGYFLEKIDIEVFGGHYTGAAVDDIRLRPLDALTELPSLTSSTIVATCGFDPLRDEGDDYAKALATRGVSVVHRTYAGFPHGFVNMLGISENARKALRECARDLEDALR